MAAKCALQVFFVSLVCIYQFSSGDPCTSGPEEFFSYNGTLSSPNYPGNYPDNARCQWRIRSTSDLVYLLITSIHTEATGAKRDTLWIYNGYNQSAELLTAQSGNPSYGRFSVTSRQPYMYLLFESDSSVNYPGFTAEFTSIKACDSIQTIINITNGTFSSPNYPNVYPDTARVCWLIQSVTDFVTLTFTNFSTSSNFDFVMIYDGSTFYDPTIAKLTGKMSNLPSFNSTQKFLLVWFSADWNFQKSPGFEAVFTSNSASSESSKTTTATITSDRTTAAIATDSTSSSWTTASQSSSTVADSSTALQTTATIVAERMTVTVATDSTSSSWTTATQSSSSPPPSSTVAGSSTGYVEEKPSTAIPKMPTFLQCWKRKVSKKNKAYCRKQLCGTKAYRIQRRRLCRRRRVQSN